MLQRQLGTTGLSVSALGFGAGAIGDLSISDDHATRVVHAALDHGVTLIDTARSYGASEDRIARAIEGRRNRVILSTKVGYGIEGAADWSYESVSRGIDEALAKLKTGHIDIVHLHSCSEEVLRAGEATRALNDAVHAGKVRVAAYSGDNNALDEAALSSAFGSIELSVNPWDEEAIDHILWRAKDRGLGVIAKRPLANAWWRHEARPDRADVATYWERGKRLGLPSFGMSPDALSIRFTVYTWGVDSAIVGTTRPESFGALALAIEEGPLPDPVREHIRSAWRNKMAGARGVV
ncbi:MAG: aldo/keto reductase [Polyangiaceae bacterium]|nr:aldo/keto reductase [Polyangiaceae bacterium]